MRFRVLTAGGVACALAAAGCGQQDQPYRDVPKNTKVNEDVHHDHAEHGPHGGHLVELGEEEYHGEVTFDAKDAKITVYILDGTAKKATPIDSKEVMLNLTLGGKPKSLAVTAAPDSGDPKDKSSRFVLAGNADVKTHIKDAEGLTGRLNATIGGKAYSGDIEHHHH